MQPPVGWYDVGGTERQVAHSATSSPRARLHGGKWLVQPAAGICLLCSQCAAGVHHWRHLLPALQQRRHRPGRRLHRRDVLVRDGRDACGLRGVRVGGGASCSGTTPVCNHGGPGNDTRPACNGDADCTTNTDGSHCLSSGACGPEPSSGSSSSRCSSTGSFAPTLEALRGLCGLLLRRRLSAAQRQSATAVHHFETAEGTPSGVQSRLLHCLIGETCGFVWCGAALPGGGSTWPIFETCLCGSRLAEPGRLSRRALLPARPCGSRRCRSGTS